MRILPVCRAIFVLTLLLAGSAEAAPARFWISTDGQDPGTPGVAEFVAASGTPRRLHIWAQPRTTSAGDWHASTNPFLEFQNVSLNVVSQETTYSIDPSNIDVYNPVLTSGNPRFGDVHDSSTGMTESPGTSPGLYDYPPAPFSQGLLGLQGYSIPATLGDGFGVSCDAADPYCGTTTSGSPAWLFASFTLTPSTDTGSIQFALQVGTNGMNHVGEDSSAMEVEFGVDTIGAAPSPYDPSLLSDRDWTFPVDDRDAVLTLAGPGDYNADGAVDSLDYAVWESQFGANTYDADGNGDGLVNLADYVVWRNNYAPTKGAIVYPLHVPEPATWSLLGLLLVTLARLARATRSSTGG